MATHFKICAVILLQQMWPYMPALHNAQAMHNKEGKLIKYMEKFKRNYSLSFLLDCLVCHFKWQPFVGFKVSTLFEFQYRLSSGRLRPHLKKTVKWPLSTVSLLSSEKCKGLKVEVVWTETQRSCRRLNPSLWNAGIVFRKSHKVNEQFASK